MYCACWLNCVGNSGVSSELLGSKLKVYTLQIPSNDLKVMITKLMNLKVRSNVIF